MVGLIIIFIFWVVRHSWNEYRKKKQYRQKPFPGNWIEAWLEQKSYRYFSAKNEVELHYLLDARLNTCCVNVSFWVNLNEPHLIVEVAYPVFIPDDKIYCIRSLVKQLNSQIEVFQLMLEKQSGRLYFRYQTKSELGENQKKEEVIADLERMIVLADNSFPEIMRVLYGSSFPELASLKIFGFPDPALN